MLMLVIITTVKYILIVTHTAIQFNCAVRSVYSNIHKLPTLHYKVQLVCITNYCTNVSTLINNYHAAPRTDATEYCLQGDL